jgi:hypothetical protein
VGRRGGSHRVKAEVMADVKIQLLSGAKEARRLS